jgi:hypothetical protein
LLVNFRSAATLETAQAEIATLEHKLQVLTARLAKLDHDGTAIQQPQAKSAEMQWQLSELDSNVAFQDTAHLLLNIISHLNHSMNVPAGVRRFVIDVDAKEIRDNALRPTEQKIAGVDRGRWFFDWVRRHRDFLLNP